jgi:hypothetical protein
MISELEKKLDNALRDAEYERNIRKNLQHVIVSQWGVDAITNCIKQIREVEQSIGPLGPINDYSLAQILSSTLQLPAELIIADLKAQILVLENKISSSASKHPRHHQYGKSTTLQKLRKRRIPAIQT